MPRDWFAKARAEDASISEYYQRCHAEDCAAGRHYWRPNGSGHSCSTCHTYSADPALTDCPRQGERVAA